jgi:hypothetical protein
MWRLSLALPKAFDLKETGRNLFKCQRALLPRAWRRSIDL